MQNLFSQYLLIWGEFLCMYHLLILRHWHCSIDVLLHCHCCFAVAALILLHQPWCNDVAALREHALESGIVCIDVAASKFRCCPLKLLHWPIFSLWMKKSNCFLVSISGLHFRHECFVVSFWGGFLGNWWHSRLFRHSLPFWIFRCFSLGGSQFEKGPVFVEGIHLQAQSYFWGVWVSIKKFNQAFFCLLESVLGR